MGYCYFNLKRFKDAKPLFNEIHQLPDNKYYIPANYYYGFISYADRNYTDALKSFKLVETRDEYKGKVEYIFKSCVGIVYANLREWALSEFLRDRFYPREGIV